MSRMDVSWRINKKKKNTIKYQTRPGGPEGENRNAKHSLRTENKMKRKFTKLIAGR